MMGLPVQIHHQLASMPSEAHPRKNCVSTPLQSTPPPRPRTGLGLTEAWALVEPGTLCLHNHQHPLPIQQLFEQWLCSQSVQFSISFSSACADRCSLLYARKLLPGTISGIPHCNSSQGHYLPRNKGQILLVVTFSISSLNKCRKPLLLLLLLATVVKMSVFSY